MFKLGTYIWIHTKVNLQCSMRVARNIEALFSGYSRAHSYEVLSLLLLDHPSDHTDIQVTVYKKSKTDTCAGSCIVLCI